MKTDREYLDEVEQFLKKYVNEEISGDSALNALVEMFKVLWD
jgi:hypothetical protein